MSLAQLFCRHKFNSVRKTENQIKKVAMPNNRTGETFQFIKGLPTEFYTITKTTEVFCCEKCGKFNIIVY